VDRWCERSYYYHAGKRVAMRQGDPLTFIASDHFGSTSALADASGNLVARLRYDAWGTTRYSESEVGTDYRFTGLRYQAMLDLCDCSACSHVPSCPSCSSCPS
jgi:uncharacterized protein RhaS with RHS repeats